MSTKKPWKDADVRVKKGINFRMTEVDYEKLVFVHHATRLSMQKILEGFVWPGIERTLKDLEDGVPGSCLLRGDNR